MAEYLVDMIIAVIQTDCSAMFDTVVHQIVLTKLKHYHINGKEEKSQD